MGLPRGERVQSDEDHGGPERSLLVADVLMVAILLAFFALAVAFVKACERVVGADVEVTREVSEPTTAGDGEVAA
jgi:hypothetical protein